MASGVHGHVAHGRPLCQRPAEPELHARGDPVEEAGHHDEGAQAADPDLVVERVDEDEEVDVAGGVGGGGDVGVEVEGDGGLGDLVIGLE
ncbi:unnamed protein product [Sphagnum tenellum]